MLTDATGTTTVLGPDDACCSWALTVEDLDPAPTPTTHRGEALRWDSALTRITSAGATTPLHRVVDGHETEVRPQRLAVVLDHARRPDEVVTTGAPTAADRSATTAGPTTADGAPVRAAAIWSHHLDALTARGAHPDPVDDDTTTTVEVVRRLVVRVRAEVGCDGVPDHVDVVGTCEATLATSRDATGPAVRAPRLGSWIEVGEKLASADTPTGPMVTTPELDWDRVTEDGTSGVAVRSVPVGEHAITWRGGIDVSVPVDDVAVVWGQSLQLVARGGSAVGAVHAEATTTTRLRLGLARAEEPACPCGAAHVVVEVGDDGIVVQADGRSVPVTPA